MDDINIQKRLTNNQKDFFNTLSNYIDDEIHIYGSIKRFDYIADKSDIDVDIFTDNESSLINKLCNLLNMKKCDFNKVLYKIDDNNIVKGFKTKYENAEKKLKIELSIYNNKNRQQIIKQHEKANNLPFFILFLLYILKYLYYKLGIISDIVYSNIKNVLIHMSTEKKFILL